MTYFSTLPPKLFCLLNNVTGKPKIQFKAEIKISLGVSFSLNHHLQIFNKTGYTHFISE